MLKKIVFQAHWMLGITFGVAMGVSGLTGSLIAFDQEITQLFRQPPAVSAQGKALLPPEQLTARILEARPDARIAMLRVSADPAAAAVVSFLPQRAERGNAGEGGMGAGMGGQPGMAGQPGMGAEQGMAGEQGMGGGKEAGVAQYVNPYTGELLPTPGESVAAFFRVTEQIHRGTWVRRDTAPGRVMQFVMGYGAFFLLLMVPTGLYLRWPRGIAARRWKSWLAINFRLKGTAFLWSLHAVLGTFVFAVYLFSAHTGVMRSHATDWYSQSLRAAMGTGGQREGGARQRDAGGREGPEQLALNGNLSAAWASFQSAVPAFATATLAMARAPDGPPVLRVAYLPPDKGSAAATVMTFDAGSGMAVPDSGAPLPEMALPGATGEDDHGPARRSSSTWKTVLDGSKEVHTGRYFGKVGQLIVGLSSLMMPVLLISGYMMYLNRRRRKVTWTTRVKRG